MNFFKNNYRPINMIEYEFTPSKQIEEVYDEETEEVIIQPKKKQSKYLPGEKLLIELHKNKKKEKEKKNNKNNLVIDDKFMDRISKSLNRIMI